MKTQIFAAVPIGWLPENRNGVAASADQDGEQDARQHARARRVRGQERLQEAAAPAGFVDRKGDGRDAVIGAPPETGPAGARPARGP